MGARRVECQNTDGPSILKRSLFGHQNIPVNIYSLLDGQTNVGVVFLLKIILRLMVIEKWQNNLPLFGSYITLARHHNYIRYIIVLLLSTVLLKE